MSEQLQVSFRRAWLNHCRDSDHFPRRMLFLTHKEKHRRKGFLAPNFGYLFNKSMLFMGKRSTYVAVYCKRCVEWHNVDMIYLDLDSPKDLDVAYTDALKVQELFPATIYFTGKNGFGVYIKTFPTRLVHPCKAIRKFVAQMESELGIETIDWHVIGVMNQVSRLPYTVNMKNEKLCIPINPDWSMEHILNQSEKCTEFVPVLFKPSPMVAMLLKGFDKNIKEIELKQMDFSKMNSSRYKEEVEQLLEIAPKIEDGRHTLIFHGIVPRMILCGAKDEEILATVKTFIERTPDNAEKESIDSYLAYASRDIENTRTRLADGEPVKFRMDTILMDRPELLEYFRK